MPFEAGRGLGAKDVPVVVVVHGLREELLPGVRVALEPGRVGASANDVEYSGDVSCAAEDVGHKPEGSEWDRREEGGDDVGHDGD